MSTEAIELTESQLQVLKHALGVDWSTLPYRNGFKAPEGHADRGTCESLVVIGLMSRTETVYFVTNRGFQVMFGAGWRAMKARAEE